MQQQLSDPDIIRLVLNGQQKAFSVLVDRYQQFVFTVAMRYINNREEAEELAQDVFIKAYRSLADFKGNSKFSTWLYTITHNTCLSFLRKRRDNTVSTDATPALSSVFVAGEKASDKAHARSATMLLNHAIAQLEATDAEIISLFYQAEQTIEEIAFITGQTPNNVKVRLFRARQKLKNILETRYPSEIAGLNSIH